MGRGRQYIGTEVAIIGLSFEFPGARDEDALWDLLLGGKSAARSFASAVPAAPGAPAADAPRTSLSDSPDYVPVAAVLDDIARFDAAFFGMTPQEAAMLDPQQRKVLEQCWRALEHAGRAGEACGLLTGVFAGVSPDTYLFDTVDAADLAGFVGSIDIGRLAAHDKDFAATRVAYRLGLRGPAQTIQTACSTGLVLVHAACRALQAGDCDMALAAAASVRVPHEVGYIHRQGGILSADGVCRPFDAEANGCIPGSGAAAVVLKRLDDAMRDGDTIHAVILGSAVNNDGDRKVGFAAPSVEGQAEVIRLAHAAAEVAAEDIGYVEAHGTGTRLGDPAEMAALAMAFAGDPRSQGCGIASIKGNLGHLDAAAGLAGLIKTVLALQHRVLPPSAHFHRLNPEISLEGTPFFIVREARPWVGPAPRMAGVSSFGVGGTNAHVVLAEPPDGGRPATGPAGAAVCISLSAPSVGALRETAAALAEHLERRPGIRPADVALTLARGRRALPCRLAVVAVDLAQVASALRDWIASGENAGVVLPRHAVAGAAQSLAAAATRWVSGDDSGAADLLPVGGGRVPLPGVALRPLRHWAARAGRAVAAGGSSTGTPDRRPPPTQASAPAALYGWSWTCDPVPFGMAPAKPPIQPAACIIVHDGMPLAAALLAELRSQVPVSEVLVPAIDSGAFEQAFAAARTEGCTAHAIVVMGSAAHGGSAQGHTRDSAESRFLQLLPMARALAAHPKTCVQFDMLTVGRFQVLGDELIDAAASIVEGPLAVWPQEFTGLHCASYDFDARDLDGDTTRLARRTAVALLSRRIGTFAVRRSMLWQRQLLRTSDPASPAIEHGLADRFGEGTVLVAGGTGGIGSALVDAILREQPSRRIAILERPIKATADRLAWQEETFELGQQVDRALDRSPMQLLHLRPDILELLHRLCAARIVGYLTRLGFALSAPPFTRSDLDHAARPLPALRRLLDFFVAELVKDGYLKSSGSTLHWCAPAITPGERDGDAAHAALLAADPDLAGTLDLLERCASLYEPAIRGEMDPISVLFPEGGSQLMKPAADSMIGRSVGKPLTEVLAAWAARMAHDTDGEPFRILEVGAGNGLLTRELVNALSDASLIPRVQFFVTDIGRHFVDEARLRHDGQGLEPTFRVFDITLDPVAQGLETRSFDMVCGLNVVHATPDVAKTLENLRRLLKPRGRIALIESILQQRWVDMVAGLARGWWSFTDHRVLSPLMGIDGWVDAMGKAGLQGACGLPSAGIWRDRADCALLLAVRSEDDVLDSSSIAAAQASRHGRAGGVAPKRYAADLRDAAQVKAAVDRVRAESGPITGVIHCAGRISGALARNLTSQDVDVEFGARAGGALALVDATRCDPVQMFLMSSSLNVVIGGEGQSAYVAANAVLAGLGRRLVSEGRRCTVVHWDRWIDTGLGTSFQSRYAHLTGRSAPGGMRADQALTGLARALALEVSEVVVAGAEGLDERMARYAPRSSEPEPATAPPSGRPAAPTGAAGERASLAVMELCRRELGLPGLSVESRLLDAGVDSLDVLSLQDALEKELGLRIFTAALISESLGQIARACLSPGESTATLQVALPDRYQRFLAAMGSPT